MIFDKLMTPILLIDENLNIVYENKEASQTHGQSLMNLNVFEAFLCFKDEIEFKFQADYCITKELFDPATGMYWRVYVSAVNIEGKNLNQIQFIDINMQKLKANKFYSIIKFSQDRQEEIEDMFEKILDAEFARSSRSGTHYALIVYSIDDLPKLIEEKGVYSVNKICQEIGNTWANNIRIYDYAPFYLGKNLFAVILPAVEKDLGMKIVEKIYDKMKDKASLSIGIADSSDAPSANNLLTLVQRALYVAQQRGGNSIAKG